MKKNNNKKTKNKLNRKKTKKYKRKSNLEKEIKKILKDYEKFLNKNSKKKKKKGVDGGIVYNRNDPITAHTDWALIDSMRHNHPNMTGDEIRDELENIPVATEYSAQQLSDVKVIKEKSKEGKVIVPVADYLDLNVEHDRDFYLKDENIEKKKNTQTICSFCKTNFKTNEQYTRGECGCLYHVNCFEEVCKTAGDISIQCLSCYSINKFNTNPWNYRDKACANCGKSYEGPKIKTKCHIMCVSCNSYLKPISYNDCDPVKRKNLKIDSKTFTYDRRTIWQKVKSLKKTIRKNIGNKMKTIKTKTKKRTGKVRPETFVEE